jgi:hypothetical protein
MRIDKQWIIDETAPIEVTIHNSLYQSALGGDSPEMGYVGDIRPDVTINVTVTVHDIKGNVELTELATAEVTPVDNSHDDEAPPRINDLDVYDFPLDDGTRLLLEFGLSSASDLDYYEVYASTSPFSSVGQAGNGPMTPLKTLSRSHEQPIVLDSLLLGDPILPNVPITVAVVAYDTNGNVHLDGLMTVTESATDNGISDPGASLPDILGVKGEWDEDGQAILVTWLHSTDTRVESYRIWIGEDSFSQSGDVIDATMVGMENNENSFRISVQAFAELDNSTSWWIGISAVDEMTYRHEISPVIVAAYSDSGDGSSGGGETTTTDDRSFFDEILEPTNMLIIILLLAILAVMVMLVRGKGGRRNVMWELQESTWGIADSGWDNDLDPLAGEPRTAQTPLTPPPEMAAGVFSAAADIQQKATPDIPPQSQGQFSQQPQVQLPQQQEVEPQQQPSGIDTSFLDDLL